MKIWTSVNFILVCAAKRVVSHKIFVSEKVEGLANRYNDWSAGFTIRASFPGRARRFFCSQKRLDRVWAAPSLLFSGYCPLHPCSKRLGREANRQPLVPRLRMSGSRRLPPPVNPNGVRRDKVYPF